MIKEEDIKIKWDSFLFYQAECSKIESEYLEKIQVLEQFISHNLNPTQLEKNKLKKSIVKTINILYPLYRKQLQSIEDLLCDYKLNIKIANKYDVSIQTLNSSKNSVVTAMYSIEDFKEKINDILI